ncbi:MAG: TlpA family protein disulfide reductase [archaeon]
MENNKKTILYLGVLLITILSGYLIYDKYVATEPSIEIGVQNGNLLLDQEITSIDGGETILFSDYRDSVLIIDFMAPWCEPCKLQIPYLREVESIPGVEVVTINIDTSYDTEYLLNLKEEENIRWFFGTNPSSALDFEVNAIPTILIVDQEGVIVHRSYFTSDKDFQRILPDLID